MYLSRVFYSFGPITFKLDTEDFHKNVFSSCEFHENRREESPKLSRDGQVNHIHVCTVQPRDILSVKNALVRHGMQHRHQTARALQLLTVV